MKSDIARQFENYLLGAKRILITSHLNPDADALGSSLLLAQALRLRLAGKQISHVLEDQAPRFDFLAGYDAVVFEPPDKAVARLKPDLLIIVDADSFERVSRSGAAALRSWLAKNNVASVVIDHHQPSETENHALVINRLLDGGAASPAATQDVYRLCFELLGYPKPKGYSELTLAGIVGDTGRFAYQNAYHRETFAIVSDLLDGGASIEKIENRLHRYDRQSLAVLAELLANVKLTESYTYSYVSDSFANSYDGPAEALKASAELFANQYIRNVEDRQWGFIVYPDSKLGKNYFSVSLRSLAGGKDVAEIAKKLGGGGHRPAAGGKLQARSAKAAIQLVQAAIDETDV